MHFSYVRYLDNTLRNAYGFVGTPIRFHFRPRAE
jgi:GTP-binding protein